MTDTQLYLSVGLPMITVLTSLLIGLLVNNAQLARFERSMDQRFADLDKRLAETDKRTQAQFETINAKLDAQRQVFDTRLSSIETRLGSLETRFDMLLGKVVDLDNRVTRMEARLP